MENENKTALRNKAVDMIKNMLLNNECVPGSPIREIDVSNILNISRIPVREAFRILEQEGLLEYIPNCGVRVKKFQSKDIREIYSVRLMLDLFIVDEVFEHITQNDLRDLGILVKRMANRQDFPLCNDLFHNKIIMLSDNSRIHYIWNNMEDQVRLIMLSCSSTENLHKISLKLHKDIIDALLQNDKDAYRSAMINHSNVAVNCIIDSTDA